MSARSQARDERSASALAAGNNRLATLDEVAENAQLSRWAAILQRSARQVGAIHEADAELIRLQDGTLLALKVDTVAEEIKRGLYREPRTAGRVAAAGALSDLAAVGAEPIGLLLAVSLPARDDAEHFQDELARGVAEVCEAAHTFVLGGDTNEASELSITMTAAGLVPEAQVLRRVGCAPDDVVFASGPLGAGAALAATALLGLPRELFCEDAYRPPVRIAQGLALRAVASCCMDTSDGLIATLDQLARLNQVAIHVDRALDELLEARVQAVQRVSKIPAFAFLACHHGEFELVFTVPPAQLPVLEARAGAIGWTPLRLGTVAAGRGLSLNGRAVDGARVRNLFRELGADPAAYVQALCAEGA